jgi:hypothetical protein
MSKPAASTLATALRRKFARRLAWARWAKIGLIPTGAVIYYFGHWSQWFVYGGAVLLLLEIVAINVGEAQRCPLCDASLVIRKDRHDEFASACPECGYVID